MDPIQEIQESTAADLGALLDAGDDAVVTLVAGDTRLVAHRAVLAARSPMFAAMLRDDTLESGSGQLSIADVVGPVLRQLLAYMYTLQVPQLRSMAPHLLVAAEKYGLSGLKSACEQQVAGDLAVENAATTAVLALQHSCPSLKLAIVAFIKAHTHQVMMTQGWADAVVSHPHTVVELTRLITEPPQQTSAAAATGSGTSPATGSGTSPATGSGTSPATGSGTSPATGPHSDRSAHTDRRPLPVAATPPTRPTPARHTQQHGASPVISSLRNLSEEERGKRLLQASMEGEVQELRVLLAAGEDVRARDGREMTALHWAVVGGSTEAVRCLVDAGAEVDARDVMRNTPMHFAAAGNHGAIVHLLAAASADPNARNLYGRPPLYCAALNGNAESATALLEVGADKTARDDMGKSPLDIAREKNQQHLLQMLK